jgi:hypothetical protein
LVTNITLIMRRHLEGFDIAMVRNKTRKKWVIELLDSQGVTLDCKQGSYVINATIDRLAQMIKNTVQKRHYD